MDITKWEDTWGTIDWEKDPEDEILQKITDFYHAGVDFNMENVETRPLSYAAVYCSEKVVDLLIDGGADINLKDSRGMTALHWVAEAGKTENVRCLVEHSPKNFVNIKDECTKETPLHYAVSLGHPETAEALIELGADVCAKSNDDEMPLHCAARNGNSKTVRLLIEHGASVNAQDKTGHTPLHWAVYRGSLVVTKELLDAGADPTIQKDNGSNALHEAIYYNHLNIMKMLLAHNPNLINRIENSTRTELHTAALNGKEEVVKALIEAVPDVVNRQDDIGQTALFEAVKQDHSNVLKALIERGADVDIKDINDRKAVDFALNREIIGLLFSARQIRTTYLLNEKKISVEQLLKNSISQISKTISAIKNRKTR